MNWWITCSLVYYTGKLDGMVLILKHLKFIKVLSDHCYLVFLYATTQSYTILCRTPAIAKGHPKYRRILCAKNYKHALTWFHVGIFPPSIFSSRTLLTSFLTCFAILFFRCLCLAYLESLGFISRSFVTSMTFKVYNAVLLISSVWSYPSLLCICC